MFVFNREGKLLSETPIKPRLPSNTDLLIPLGNDRYLYRRVDIDTTRPVAKIALVYSIVDHEYSEIKELDRLLIVESFSPTTSEDMKYGPMISTVVSCGKSGKRVPPSSILRS
jgi:hypothetical protein